MPRWKKETYKIPFDVLQGRLMAITESDLSETLAGQRISKNPVTYAIYLKKAVLPLGFHYQYKTALLIGLFPEESNTTVETSIQTPPFVPILTAIIIFGFLFYTFLLRASLPFEFTVFLVLLNIAVLVYHSWAKERIQSKVEEEILFEVATQSPSS